MKQESLHILKGRMFSATHRTNTALTMDSFISAQHMEADESVPDFSLGMLFM